jgi:hypothetical protein
MQEEVFKSFCIHVVRRCAIIAIKWVEDTFKLQPYGSR